MAAMPTTLDAHDGHRVLEVGTGTGYNAALLAHRLEDSNVTTSELGDDEVMALTAAGSTVDQTSHRLLCDVLRATVHAGSGAAEWDGSIRYRASVVLYLLLLDHPIDRRGRCRSCRRPGRLIRLRRRTCRIHLRASYWLLRQPDDVVLLSYLANEPGVGTGPLPQAPVVPPPLPPRRFPRAGRPDPITAGPGSAAPTAPVPP